MLAEDQLERRIAYDGAVIRVVGKLDKVEQTYPIVFFGEDIVLEILLKHVVDPFCLAVGLQMEGDREVELCPE